ncbi:hypothetical protein DFH27DRAFT_61079 [Peziza echinospora]|nr:hypothetical protein DFH27DRAFT_61079 [Peziza echinospora]
MVQRSLFMVCGIGVICSQLQGYSGAPPVAIDTSSIQDGSLGGGIKHALDFQKLENLKMQHGIICNYFDPYNGDAAIATIKKKKLEFASIILFYASKRDIERQDSFMRR